MQEKTESKRNEIVISPRPSHSRRLSKSVIDQVENKKYGITSLDVWALGITVVIGGQYFSWNFGLSAGVGTYGIALLLIIVGYTCLILCISEISSGLPFAGGSYGLARCTLGNYWGFMLGCSETIEYIFYVATAVHFLGVMIELLMPGSQDYAPVTWLVTYIVSLLIYIFGGKYFWTFNMFLAIASIGIEIMFCFGSLKYVDFTQYAAYPATGDQNPWFTGNMSDFMKVMPIAAWFFVGVEALKETCNDLDEPKLQIPRGQVSCVLTLAVLAIMVYFITVSLPPGIVSLSTNDVPFNLGFQLMFNLSDEQTFRYATILSIPATFATCFGFIMMYGKIITAMAHSKLMPSILSRRYSKTGAPYLALCAGSLASYGVCLVCYVYEDMVNQLFNISILAAFFGYSSQCLCYILLKTKYSNIKCDFQSPFGIYGAIVALCIWTLGAISIIGFQDDGQKALIAVVIIYGTLTIWYFAYAKSRQSFSDEEKKIFFTIHVINYNSSKKRVMRRASEKMRNQSELAGLRALFGLPPAAVPADRMSSKKDAGIVVGNHIKNGLSNSGDNDDGKDNSDEKKKKSSGGSDYVSYYGDIDPSRGLEEDESFHAQAAATAASTAVVVPFTSTTPATSTSTGSSNAITQMTTLPSSSSAVATSSSAASSSLSSPAASPSPSTVLLGTTAATDKGSISDLLHSVRMSLKRRGNKVGISPATTANDSNKKKDINNSIITTMTPATLHSESGELILDPVGI